MRKIAKDKMSKDKMVTNKSWMKFRHRVATWVARMLLYPYSRIKYGIRVEPFKEQGKRQYLILLNHQTAFDQFFVGISFSGPIYYVASEDIFSNGWISGIIRWLVAPIPIKKQTTDLAAVKNCVRVAKEGGSIAIAPEGNRTYSGKTEYMSPAIASLAKVLNLPIVLYRIEGGYGVHPRWSDVVRKGKMHSYVSRVIEPEEYKQMTNEELFAVIKNGLYVDEAIVDGEFRHKRRAEYLERAIYVCPDCGLTTLESQKATITCKKCGKRVIYQSTKELCGDGFVFPFRFVSDWYEYQKEYVNGLDLSEYENQPLYRETAGLSEVILNQRKDVLRAEMSIALYGNRIMIDEGEQELSFPFEEVSAVTVLGKNKLNIYHGGKVYQVKGDKRFNALKYVNIYHRYKNTNGEVKDDKFLGL